MRSRKIIWLLSSFIAVPVMAACSTRSVSPLCDRSLSDPCICTHIPYSNFFGDAEMNGSETPSSVSTEMEVEDSRDIAFCLKRASADLERELRGIEFDVLLRTVIARNESEEVVMEAARLLRRLGILLGDYSNFPQQIVPELYLEGDVENSTINYGALERAVQALQEAGENIWRMVEPLVSALSNFDNDMDRENLRALELDYLVSFRDYRAGVLGNLCDPRACRDHKTHAVAILSGSGGRRGAVTPLWDRTFHEDSRRCGSPSASKKREEVYLRLMNAYEECPTFASSSRFNPVKAGRIFVGCGIEKS